MEVPRSRKGRSLVEHGYQYFVGIDWATEKHHVNIFNEHGAGVRETEVEHKGSTLHAFAEELLQLTEGRPEAVAIGIETPRGALVELLVERGFHVYAINPKQLDRFRDRHTISGAKDDSLDSGVIGSSLRTDLALYRRVRLDDPVIIQVRESSRAWDDLKTDLSRLSNQLRELVYRFVPQLLTLNPGADEPWLWDILKLLADGLAPSRVRLHHVSRVLKDNRIRRFTAEDVMALLREPAPWTTPGTQEAVRMHIRLMLPRLRVTLEQCRDCERQVSALLEELTARTEPVECSRREHRDIEIISSLPGAGKVVVATMLAEASQPLADRDYHSLRTSGGIAPVTKKSGKRGTVHMRYACNVRLRDALHYWAQAAVARDPIAKSRYSEHRQRGQSHGRALRSVAERLLRVLMAVLRTGTLYDPARRSNVITNGPHAVPT